MAAPITSQTLRDLAEFRAADGVALSVYIGLDPSRVPTRAEVETHLNSVVSALEKASLADRAHDDRTQAIQEGVERIRRYFDDEFERDGMHGVAVFASGGEDGLFRVLELAGPVEDHAAIDRDLSLAPLLTHVGRHEGALVAVMDRERGQVYRLLGGRLVEVVDESEQEPGQHSQGGWSQARYQRHIEKLVQEHLKAVGGEIDRRVRRAGGLMLVVVSPDELRPNIESALSTEAREAIVGWATAEAHADADALLAVALPHIDHALAAREQEALERWRGEIGAGGRAAAGWHDTLEAASDARVEVLLIADAASREAYRCPACGRASAEGGQCPLDDASLEERDGVELALHETLVHGGTVLSVGGDLLGGEGVGALLRF